MRVGEFTRFHKIVHSAVAQLVERWTGGRRVLSPRLTGSTQEDRKQDSHRPGKVLEFDLGPRKLLEFYNWGICPGIVLECCKIAIGLVQKNSKHTGDKNSLVRS